MVEYTTVKLPDDMIVEVDKLVGKYGFSSRTEVVKSALRNFFGKYSETNGQMLGKLANIEQEA